MGTIETTAAAVADRAEAEEAEGYELTEAGEAALAADEPAAIRRRAAAAIRYARSRARATAAPPSFACLTDAELLARLHIRAQSMAEVATATDARSALVRELAARLARAEMPERLPLHRPAAAARYLVLRYGRADQEVMGALYLDGRHRLILDAELYRGTINRASVEPRAILRRGLELHATGILLFHTHPSGDPAPSAEDLAFTRRLARAAEIVGLELVDHLVLGTADRFVSLRERGAW